MDIIPNVNPRPNVATPQVAAQPAVKKPVGPVIDQRKIAAAQKAGMVVDARLYGVKPATLSKYINDMVKPSAFTGIAYNKSMLTYSKVTAYYTKTMSVGLTGLMREFSDFRKAYVPGIASTNNMLRMALQQSRESDNRPTVTTRTLDKILYENTVENRRRIKADREAQKTAYNPYDDPSFKELEETNATLKKILSDGVLAKGESKKAKGFDFENLKPEMFIEKFIKMIPYAALATAAAASVVEIARAAEIGMRTLKDIFSAEANQKKQENNITNVLSVAKGKILEQGTLDEKKANEWEKLQNEISQLQSQMGQSTTRWTTAKKLGIVKPDENFAMYGAPAYAASTGRTDKITEMEREAQVTQAIKDKQKRANQLQSEILANKAKTSTISAGVAAETKMATPQTISAGGDIQEAVNYVASQLNVAPETLAKLISFETAGTWNPTIKNPLSNARGLVQFMDGTAQELGYKDSLDLVTKNPTVVGQLKGPVLQYLKSKNLKSVKAGKPLSDQELMMSVFYPANKYASPDTTFSEKVQKQNPGIVKVSDYTNRVLKQPTNLSKVIAQTQNNESTSITDAAGQFTSIEDANRMKAGQQSSIVSKLDELTKWTKAGVMATQNQQISTNTNIMTPIGG